MSQEEGVFTSDAKILENQIDDKIQDINKVNDISKLTEYKKK